LALLAALFLEEEGPAAAAAAAAKDELADAADPSTGLPGMVLGWYALTNSTLRARTAAAVVGAVPGVP
jgi:hypothetical protein